LILDFFWIFILKLRTNSKLKGFFFLDHLISYHDLEKFGEFGVSPQKEVH